ncbi:MAG: nuclear transport factor 2 family protein [Sneathiellaceae bacterium]
MSVQPMAGSGDRNPRTWEEARAMVKHVESLFTPWNVDALVDGFTADCVIRFGDLPEFRGQEALRRFFTARSARQRDYRLVKTLKCLMGDTLCNTWEGTWEDAASGQKMTGFGCEVWQLRDGRIAVWEGAFNAAPEGGQGSMQALLT